MSGANEDALVGRAAVLLVFREAKSQGVELLLTLRAMHLRSHRGEVAFPGGMWEEGDASLQDTALRESCEEVGLPVESVHSVTSMPASYTRAGVQVTPYVGLVGGSVELRPNPQELDALFWVPEAFLRSDPRVRTDVFLVAGREYWAPVYRYGDYEIWGFTARVIVQFMNLHWQENIGRKHTAPEVKRKPLS